MPNLQTSYNWAIQWCGEPNTLYSMSRRNQYHYGRDSSGYMYFDCSSFIWFCLEAGGWNVESADPVFDPQAYNAITTDYMPAWLTNLGWVEQSLTGTWEPGDILWRSAGFVSSVGHTEMVYSGGTGQGITMGAHSDDYAASEQVSINNFYSNSSRYEKIYRYGSTPPTPPTPPTPGQRHKMPLMFFLRNVRY